MTPQPGKPTVPMTLTRCSGCGYDAWRGNYPCYRCGVVMPPVKYVAVDALLSSEAKKAAGRALAAQLAGSYESGSFADVYEEAAIVLRAAIDALGAA